MERTKEDLLKIIDELREGIEEVIKDRNEWKKIAIESSDVRSQEISKLKSQLLDTKNELNDLQTKYDRLFASYDRLYCKSIEDEYRGVKNE